MGKGSESRRVVRHGAQAKEPAVPRHRFGRRGRHLVELPSSGLERQREQQQCVLPLPPPVEQVLARVPIGGIQILVHEVVAHTQRSLLQRPQLGWRHRVEYLREGGISWRFNWAAQLGLGERWALACAHHRDQAS
eukprot:scaffold27241_cov114-Isochrysis_galbana.AAC.1